MKVVFTKIDTRIGPLKTISATMNYSSQRADAVAKELPTAWTGGFVLTCLLSIVGVLYRKAAARMLRQFCTHRLAT
jgi:hypothetical protein